MINSLKSRLYETEMHTFLMESLLMTMPDIKYLDNIYKIIDLIESARNAYTNIIFCAFGSSYHIINMIVSIFDKKRLNIEIINSHNEISIKKYLSEKIQTGNCWIIFASRSGKTFEIVSQLQYLLDNTKRFLNKIIVLTNVYSQSPCADLIRQHDILHLNVKTWKCARFEIFNLIYFFTLALVTTDKFTLKKEYNIAMNQVLTISDTKNYLQENDCIKWNTKKQILVINKIWYLSSATNWMRYIWNESFGSFIANSNSKEVHFYNYNDFFHSALEKYSSLRSKECMVLILNLDTDDNQNYPKQYIEGLFGKVHNIDLSLINLPRILIIIMCFLSNYAIDNKINMTHQTMIDNFKTEGMLFQQNQNSLKIIEKK